MALKQSPNCLQSPDGSYYVTLTDGAGNLVTAGGGTAANITAGTTTVTPTSGTQGVLFNNNGVVGSDSGFTYTGAGVGATIAITAAVIQAGGGNGTAASPAINFGNGVNNGIFMASGATINFALGGSSRFVITTTGMQIGSAQDVVVTRSAAANFQHGAADAAVAVAQTISVQNVVAGTSNVAGANWTFKGSAGTGTGAGGQIIFQTAPTGTTGTTQNAFATGLTIAGAANTMQPSVVVGNQAIATTATDGFLYIPTCAGTPSGTPTSFTGRVPMVFDTTGVKFWIFSGTWKGVVVA